MARAHRIAALTALAAGTLAVPLSASADVISVYAAGKADYVNGTGDVYERFEGDVSFGALLGFELLGIDFWGEALLMGQDQYMFTGNIGVDLTFGDDVRFTIGADTGPLVFHFPEQEVSPLIIPDFVREQIGEGTASMIESEYDKFIELEKEASQWAFGWNLARARLSLEFALVPKVLYLGAGGHVGYHYMINGEEAAADVKSIAIDQLESDYPEAAELGAFDVLRKQVGAKSIDPDNLQGINYNVGAFLKVEI